MHEFTIFAGKRWMQAEMNDGTWLWLNEERQREWPRGRREGGSDEGQSRERMDEEEMK